MRQLFESNRNTQRRLGFAGIVSVFLVIPETVRSAGAAEDYTWPDLIAGVRFERERLKAGVYRATGREHQWSATSESPVTIYSAFSFPDQRIRFDHLGRGQVRKGGELVEIDTHRVMCLFPDRTLQFSNLLSGSLILSIAPPNTMEIRERPGTQGYLDVRCLGLLRASELYKGKAFEQVGAEWAAAQGAKNFTLTDEGEGVIRATSFERGRASYWIDTKSGFTLVRCRSEMGRFDPAAREFVPASRLMEGNEELRRRLAERHVDLESLKALDVPEEIEIGWRRINGVWAPASYRHVTVTQEPDRQTGSREAKTTRIVRRETTLSFDWTSVNAAIDEEQFDYHNFGLPHGTDVFDQRAQEAVFIERIGSKKPVARFEPRTELNSNRWIVIVAANLTAALALIALVYWRRRSRAKSTM